MFKFSKFIKTESGATEVFAPPSLIAGSLRLAKGAVARHVAYNAATLALDTERVCMLLSESDGKVHYLAGAASDFASQGAGTATPLAMALPGTASFRGHGVYFSPLADGTRTACVISTEQGLKCFVGNNADAERFPEAEQQSHLPVFRLDTDPLGVEGLPRWRGFTEYDRAGGRERLQRVLVGAVACNIGMGLLWVGASIYGSRLSHSEEDVIAQARQSVTEAASTLTHTRNSFSPAWQEFQTVATFALQRQGRLMSFELKDGQVGWVVDVPEFTSSAEISAGLGNSPDLQTQRVDTTARITKKRKEKEKS